MSGGSMHYLYQRVLDADFEINTPERRAFRQRLDLVAHALKSIEWNDSGDGDSREEERIRACLSPIAVLEACVEQAHAAAKELREELERACAGAAPAKRTYLHGDKI